METIHSQRDARVFMSYARSDDTHHGGALSRFCQRATDHANSLDGRKISLFIDEDRIRPAEDFPQRLREEVLRADVLIVFASPTYIERPWCREELRLFRETLAIRNVRSPNILWVATVEGTNSHEVLNLQSIQRWATVGDLDPERAGHHLRQLVNGIAPPQPARNDTVYRCASPRVGRTPEPAPEQLQFIGALDSVRTQRGCTDQVNLVELRTKLAYLLGHTVVLTESQAFDSLGTISSVCRAARAWPLPGNPSPPVVPFRLVWFKKPKTHLVDIACAQLAREDFESSAWHVHSQHRHSLGTATGIPEHFDEWQHFLEGAHFLRWFVADAVARPTSIGLHDRLREACSTAERRGEHPHVVAWLRRVVELKTETRSEMYRSLDQWHSSGENIPVEALKDIIDIAYNRTVAQSVLQAATPTRQFRSMILTDPTPDEVDDSVLDITRHLLEPEKTSEHLALRSSELLGAWEIRSSNEDIASELTWETIFEVAREPKWLTLRNALVDARLTAEAVRTRDATMELVDWLGMQLRSNVAVSDDSIDLHERDESVGVGRPFHTTHYETGYLKRGVSDET